jgi:hypothetical protein
VLCRRRRRAQQEKSRRAEDLLSARLDDRLRQSAHRQREREKARSGRVSQAGLSAQVTESIEEIVEVLRHAQRLSQAGLRRRMLRFAQRACGKIDHGTQKSET